MNGLACEDGDQDEKAKEDAPESARILFIHAYLLQNIKQCRHLTDLRTRVCDRLM